MEQYTEKSEPAVLWSKDFVKIMICNYMLFMTVQMLTPTLPIYVKNIGANDVTVGLIMGIFTIFALVVRPICGNQLDKVARRKVFLVGLAFILCSVIGYYLLATIAFILAMRIAHGAGWAIVSTTFATVVSDILPKHRRGEGIGYYGMSANLAMALGPLTGIWVMQVWGYPVLFIISTILVIFTFLLSSTITFTMPIREETAKQTTSFWHDFFEKKALLPASLGFLFSLCYGGISGFITLFGKEAGIDNVGWFFLINATMVLLIRPFSGKLFDRKGHVWVLIPGAMCTIAGIVLLSYSTNVYMLAISSVFYGIGFGTAQPCLLAWAINRVPQNRRGVANGTFFSAFDLGIGSGALLLGVVAAMTGYAMMYRLSVVLIIVYLYIYLSYLLKRKKT